MTEEARAKCENCRWFWPFPVKEVPPEPALTIRWVGIEWTRSGVSVEMDRYRREGVIYRNESGWCVRYPEHRRKHRDSLCGEHTPTDSGEGVA